MIKNNKKIISKKDVEDTLKTVFDPELGINIVDLGLIYDIVINDNSDEVKIVMTLTSPFCPFNSFMLSNVEEQVKLLGFKKVNIELTFEPLWSPSRINKKIKLANLSPSAKPKKANPKKKASTKKK